MNWMMPAWTNLKYRVVGSFSFVLLIIICFFINKKFGLSGVDIFMTAVAIFFALVVVFFIIRFIIWVVRILKGK